jgi:hypothetical protein
MQHRIRGPFGAGAHRLEAGATAGWQARTPVVCAGLVRPPP